MKTERQFWNMVKKANWLETTDHKIVRENIQSLYSKKEIKEFQEICRTKANELKNKLNEYSISKTGNINYYNVSDDGMMDLTYHIVGSGKKVYDSVMKDPELAKSIYGVECFAYIFH